MKIYNPVRNYKRNKIKKSRRQDFQL